MEDSNEKSGASRQSGNQQEPSSNPLTVADAVEWLKSRTKGSKCPMCGWATWNILSDGDMAITIQYRRFDRPVMTPVLLTECDRCSFAASYMVGSIRAWIRDGKPDFKESRDE